jgi:hypothetical protein
MTDISKARQALRDAARVKVAVVVPLEARAAVGADVEAVEIGALAHHAFVAAQAALTVAEELRAESRKQQVIWNDDKDLSAKAEAAERIEAAVWESLT